MSLSTRVSIQWLPDDVEELTETLVFSTPKCFSTDVRIFKEHYPYIKINAEPEPIEKIFQFASIGTEVAIEGTNRVEFPSEVNLQVIIQAIKTGKRIEQCKGPVPDIGSFWSIENSEDRKETGSMVNPATEKLTEYIEVWRSLNPMETTPTEQIRENHWKGNKSEVKVRTYDAKGDHYRGRLILLGNWVQAVLYVCVDGLHQLSVARAHLNESGEWEPLIDYGIYHFPDFSKALNEEEFEHGGISWSRIE